MKTRIMYLENKETGEARIGRVTFSRTMQTVYYKDKTLQRAGSEKIAGNFFDTETGEEYWVSGCKKKGGDYHWANKVSVAIDDDVREEYWTTIRGIKLEEYLNSTTPIKY
ncbi:hypothetical protein [Pontibacter ummariensis]|nr:hypothetical protein [Pontibacter ummariensis]